MWNLIFEVIGYLLCTIAAFKVANRHDNQCKAALSKLHHNEISRGSAMTCDTLDYKRSLVASWLWWVFFYVVLYLCFSKLSALIS